MADGRYAVVENGVVTNVAIWDGESDWRPDAGEAIVCGDDVSTGWVYAGGRFEPPAAVPLDEN